MHDTSMDDITILSSPLTLPCGLTLKNRLAKGAMTEGLADSDGSPNDGHVQLYRTWAKGGCGLLITGNVMVDGTHLERPGNVILDGHQAEDIRDRLAVWAAAGSENGCTIWMQLSHSGRQCQKKVNPQPKSASDVQLGLPGGQFARPTPMTSAEIEALIAAFVRAATLAEDTGFSGVQIHAAHGYLLSQFLSPNSNQRSDEWGGSLENRARLLRLIVQQVKEACSDSFAVAVKLNSSDFQKGGFGAEDARQVVRWLADDGVDLVEISGGTYEQPRMLELGGIEPVEEIKTRASTREREAFFQAFAADIRDDCAVPLMVTGGFRTSHGMASAITEDGVNLIGIGRPLCGAPDAVNDMLAGAAELPRFERQLGKPDSFFGVNSPVMLIKAIAGFSVMAWYYAQLVRLAAGKPVALSLGTFKCFLSLQKSEAKWLKARRKSLQNLP